MPSRYNLHANLLYIIKFMCINTSATDWMIGGSSPCRYWEFFSTSLRPDRFWVPPSLL